MGVAEQQAGERDDSRERLVEVSMIFARSMLECLAGCAAQVGLPKQQAYALHLLAHQPALTMGALGDRLGADPSTVSGLVDRLSARGLIERHLDEHDRRVRTVTVTALGRELDQQVDALVRQSSPGDGWLTDDERRTLIDLLTTRPRVAPGTLRVADSLTSRTPPARPAAPPAH